MGRCVGERQPMSRRGYSRFAHGPAHSPLARKHPGSDTRLDSTLAASGTGRGRLGKLQGARAHEGAREPATHRVAHLAGPARPQVDAVEEIPGRAAAGRGLAEVGEGESIARVQAGKEPEPEALPHASSAVDGRCQHARIDRVTLCRLLEVSLSGMELGIKRKSVVPLGRLC